MGKGPLFWSKAFWISEFLLSCVLLIAPALSSTQKLQIPAFTILFLNLLYIFWSRKIKGNFSGTGIKKWLVLDFWVSVVMLFEIILGIILIATMPSSSYFVAIGVIRIIFITPVRGLILLSRSR